MVWKEAMIILELRTEDTERRFMRAWIFPADYKLKLHEPEQCYTYTPYMEKNLKRRLNDNNKISTTR